MSQDKRECISFSSDAFQGAKNIENNGSKFTVYFDSNPFYVGTDTSKNCTIEIINASIWNSNPNISSTFDNNRFIAYESSQLDAKILNKIELIIPTGQYDLTGLVAQLGLQWDSFTGLEADMKTIFSPKESFQNTFSISGSDSTQLVSIQFLSADTSIMIDWKQSTIGKILGFTTSSIQRPLALNGFLTGDLSANFNSINSYYLSSDMISQGLNINGRYGNVIGIIPITSLPGNLVNFSGNVNNLFVNSDNLLGRRNAKTQITFWLTNERYEALDMNGETFSFTVLVRWVS